MIAPPAHRLLCCFGPHRFAFFITWLTMHVSFELLIFIEQAGWKHFHFFLFSVPEEILVISHQEKKKITEIVDRLTL